MFRELANIGSQRQQAQSLAFTSFPHGLNTMMQPDRIALSECSKLVNWKILKGGKLESRTPITRYSTTATTSNSAVKTVVQANIGGTMYDLLVDANHVLYYLNGSEEATTIGTLEGDAQIMSYNGVALVMDGSYLKYLDGVAGANLKMAYDAGSGTRAYQFDHSALTNDAFLALGNGTNIGVAQKFTTQAWTAGYTLPPVTVTAYLSENGSAPAGAVTVKIRLFSDSSTILASGTMVADASGIGATATEYSHTFTSGEITTELSPATAYLVTLEYSAGDAANYVKVHCNNIGSGGLSYEGDTDLDVIGNWNADTAKHCLMSLTPARPPKAKFGAIFNKRPWLGGDPDNLGQIWYGNLTHLDWSTSDGGGYIGLIDDDSANFEASGMMAFYGNLYIFGTEAQPFLVKISGTTPADYAQDTAFQRPWSVSRGVVSAVNDLWYANGEGVSPLSGVQEYGDLRTFFASDPVFDRVKDYWSTATAWMAYYPPDGQIWLVMPSYHRVMVCHTKQPTKGPDGALRYPWAEYEFYSHDLTDTDTYKWTANGDEYYLQALAGGTPGLLAQPDFLSLDGNKITEGTAGSLADHEWDYAKDPTDTYYTIYFKDATGDPDTSEVSIRAIMLPQCAGQCGSNFLIGGSDGYVYKSDTSTYKDLSSIQMEPILQSAYIEIPFGHANFFQYHLLLSSTGGGSVRLAFFTDDAFRVTTDTTALSLRDDLLVDEATFDVDDAYVAIDADNVPMFDYINFNARMLMIAIDNVVLVGYPMVADGVILQYRRLGY